MLGGRTLVGGIQVSGTDLRSEILEIFFFTSEITSGKHKTKIRK